MSQRNPSDLNWRVVFNRASPEGRRHWGRVRAAQLRELGPAMQIAGWGLIFNALCVAYLLREEVPGSHIALWLLSLAVAGILAAHRQRKLKGRMIHSIGRRTIDRVAYFSVIFGAIWMVPARYFFDAAAPSEQLALGIMTAVMMAGAAFVFAPIPAASLGFILMMGATMTRMLGEAGTAGLFVLGPIYALAMLGVVFTNGRSFMQKTWLGLELQERQETVSLLLREYESSDADWLWRTNANLCFENVSARFARAIGRTSRELQGLTLRDLLKSTPRLDQSVRRAIAAALASLAQREGFSNLSIPIEVEGELRTIELSGRPRYSGHGRFVGYEGVGSDVTESREAAARIAHMAHHDALTGLPNRLYLLESLGSALGQAKKRGQRCALILIDLDRFKSINDTLGHIAGDHLLEQVSRCLESVISDEMTAGRLGGDEFAIVVPLVESRGELEQMCLALVGALHGPFLYQDQRLFVGASVGVAMGPRDGESVADLMRNADLALYKSKAGNGNEIRFYDPALHAQSEDRRRIELALRDAADAAEFSVYYQPVVDARSGEIESFEALLRWNSRELGAVSPARFIPIAEETGLLGKIGEWVLRSACREAAKWPAHIGIAVNVSPRQVQDPAFLVTLMSALTQAQLEPHRLELEVTESVFLELTERTQSVLQQIQSLGVRLAMDDFGTGYSSLGYLRRAEFDTLKIDQSFVQSISAGNSESTAIIRAVVALAGSLGMKTVAEGVQTEEQLQVVRSLGVDRLQGFIFSRAVDADTARAMLGTNLHSAAA
jgi:diguanylate cyclase (GGDEF)-like protein/PAS domain S-box-containing protein